MGEINEFRHDHLEYERPWRSGELWVHLVFLRQFYLCKTYEELMALCKRQREKVERSKRMKKIIFVPDTELGQP